MPIANKTPPIMPNSAPRVLAKSGPTEDTLRQCGHRAKALFNVLNWKPETIIIIKLTISLLIVILNIYFNQSIFTKNVS